MFDFESKPSFFLMVPCFACGFYAVNMWSLSTGLMDGLLPLMFGTAPEAIPLLTGPAGKVIWFSNAFSQTGLCYAFHPSTGMNSKKVFTTFLIVQLPWLPLLYYMFATGLMGMTGIAMFGSFAGTVTALSVYSYTKL